MTEHHPSSHRPSFLASFLFPRALLPFPFSSALAVAALYALPGCSGAIVDIGRPGAGPDQPGPGAADDPSAGPSAPGAGTNGTGTNGSETSVPGSPPIPGATTLVVELTPTASVTVGQPTRVALGVPLPMGMITDLSALWVTPAGGGADLPLYREVLAPWRPPVGDASVRVALLQFDVTFSALAPMSVELNIDPAQSHPATIATRASWANLSRLVADGEDPSFVGADQVREPKVLAALPARWMCDSRAFGRELAAADLLTFDSFDTAMENFSQTATNEVPSTVLASEKVPVRADYEPWLYDRTRVIGRTYLRTGNVRWLRHALRSASFYGRHIAADGTFDLKAYADSKYAYTEGPALAYLLTGDETMLPVIDRVAAYQAGENIKYTSNVSPNFWTERDQAYILRAANWAYIVRGLQGDLDRINAIKGALIQHQKAPPSGMAADGCWPHSGDQHSEGTGTVCSPWMSALLLAGLLDTYDVTGDPELLDVFTRYGAYLRDIAVKVRYVDSYSVAMNIPVGDYLATSTYQFSEYDDAEHNVDNAFPAALAYWASAMKGAPDATMKTLFSALYQPWQDEEVPYWTRTDPSRPIFRLQPPRKYGWWFGVAPTAFSLFQDAGWPMK